VKCFHCLLSPAGDDPIFIGINRLLTKGLRNWKHDPPQYPCEVVDTFQCPYERTSVNKAMNSTFDVKDLFKLREMAFAVEISLAKTRKEDSMARVNNKEELLHALTHKETAKEDEIASLLMTIPGTGYYSALLIISEVGDINGFSWLLPSMLKCRIGTT
jgi:hypothetical protein